ISAHVTLTHANGAISHVRGDWFGPETPFRSQVEVAGAEGILRFDTDELAGIRVGYLPPASDVDPYQAQLADFVDAIRTGRDARVTPGDGVAAVALVDAAYASLASGHPIVLCPACPGYTRSQPLSSAVRGGAPARGADRAATRRRSRGARRGS